MSHPQPAPQDDPTPPHGRARPGAPTPPFGTAVPAPGPRYRRHTGSHPRIAARRHGGPRRAGGRGRRRLVELARVLAGGLVVLALAVVAGPWLLGGPGAGGAVLAGHVVGALVATGATAVAAHPRTPPRPAVLATLVVPVDVLVVLGSYWWA